MIHCDDFARAVKPVPPPYLHPDYINIDAAVGTVGNHLIDSKSPELRDPSVRFRHNWVYGAYDGRIAFYQVKLAWDYLLGRPDHCRPIIKRPVNSSTITTSPSLTT